MESLRCEVWCYYIFVPEELSSLQKSFHQGDLPFWAEEKQKLLFNVTKLSFFLGLLHSDDKHYIIGIYYKENELKLVIQVEIKNNASFLSTVIITLYEFFIIKQCLITWPC